MPNAVVVIPTDLHTNKLGLPSRISDHLAGRTVLAQTVARAAKIPSIKAVVIVHPSDQQPAELLAGLATDKPVYFFAAPDGLSDIYTPMRIASRKWALTCWRGGLGGSLCYDELLPAKPLAQALEAHRADAAILIGADWPLVDPELCEQVLKTHLAHPEKMQMTFTQAPPGLAGTALSAALLQKMIDTPATLGQLIAYDPKRPQADPIGRDVCANVPAEVRRCARRFIYDTPRSIAMIDAIADHLGAALFKADASTTAHAFHAMTQNGQADAFIRDFADLPQQVAMELNTTRIANGPLVVQHHTSLDRPPIATDEAIRMVQQLGAARDVALTLGGLGDPLLHEGFFDIIAAAHEAGVFGVAVETDLLVDENTLDKLLDSPVDVVSVRINADTPETYRKLMGVDRFTEMIHNIEWLINTRNRRAREQTDLPAAQRTVDPGTPWLAPRFIKTADNLAELEPFFDRWMHHARCAVIESPTTGCGRIPDVSLMHMAPPKRDACRQLARRLTVHCDGRIALCDQDWAGQAPLGAATDPDGLASAWRQMQVVHQKHREGEWDQMPLCADCHQWHRP